MSVSQTTLFTQIGLSLLPDEALQVYNTALFTLFYGEGSFPGPGLVVKLEPGSYRTYLFTFSLYRTKSSRSERFYLLSSLLSYLWATAPSKEHASISLQAPESGQLLLFDGH